MAISPKDVLQVAQLARLAPAQDKLNLFAEQLADILGYMDKLSEVDTRGVPPMFSPVEHVTVTRPDVVQKKYERKEILANAPEHNGTYFIVPRII